MPVYVREKVVALPNTAAQAWVKDIIFHLFAHYLKKLKVWQTSQVT